MKPWRIEFDSGVEEQIDAMPEEMRQELYRHIFALAENPENYGHVCPADEVPPEVVTAIRERHPEMSVDEILAMVRYIDL